VQNKKLLRGKTLEELGSWASPVEPEVEPLVQKALVGLCTVIYKAFPTSIQQDKKLLAELEQQLQQQQKKKMEQQQLEQQHHVKEQQQLEQQQEQHQVKEQQQQNQEGEMAGAVTVVGGGITDPGQLHLAVRYRLAKKQLLEEVTRTCLMRLKELTA
jgi:hypothetical protein